MPLLRSGGFSRNGRKHRLKPRLQNCRVKAKCAVETITSLNPLPYAGVEGLAGAVREEPAKAEEQKNQKPEDQKFILLGPTRTGSQRYYTYSMGHR